MKTKPLLPGQPVTAKGEPGSAELIEVIQRLVKVIEDHEARIKALEP